jgi:N-acetylated-alpha-linked acidic dipeptidase
VYLRDLKKLTNDAREETLERNREVDEGLFDAVRDPRHPTVAPPKREEVPYLDFSPMDNAADELSLSAKRYEAALTKAWLVGLRPATLVDLNHKLIESERRLTTSEGLLRRPWYKHMIYAPGVYTGYDVKTVPGVREAIEQKHWDEANSEIQRAGRVLDNERALLDSLTSVLEQSGRPR